MYQSLPFGVNALTTVIRAVAWYSTINFCKQAPSLVSSAGSFIVLYEAAAFIGLRWQEREGRSEPSCCSWNWKIFIRGNIFKPDKTHCHAQWQWEKRILKIRKYSESMIVKGCVISWFWGRFSALRLGNKQRNTVFHAVESQNSITFFF